MTPHEKIKDDVFKAVHENCIHTGEGGEYHCMRCNAVKRAISLTIQKCRQELINTPICRTCKYPSKTRREGYDQGKKDTASQIFEELELIENEEQINIWQMNGDVARKYRDLKSKYLKEKSE